MLNSNITLSETAKQIHQQLVSRIVEQIEAAGQPLDFQAFMQMALYTPRLGYYQNAIHKIGPAGDFITAPEMGNRFAQCFANAISSVDVNYRQQLLELGAGSGAMAVEVLKRLEVLQCLPAHYWILEPSASLQALQRERLLTEIPHLAERVGWLQSLPSQFCGIVFGNEVADAIPCQRLKRVDGIWYQMAIEYKNHQFEWTIGDAVSIESLPSALRQTEDFIEGYQTEVRPLLKPWLTSLSAMLDSGYLIVFDYGYVAEEYYHPQRLDGTLRCFSRHVAHNDPLAWVGLQDITAHVDFTELATAAVEMGFEVEGFTTQAGFLIENGLLEDSADMSAQQNYLASQEIQKLIAPGQMGETVKVIQLTKNTTSPMPGFQRQNRLGRL